MNGDGGTLHPFFTRTNGVSDNETAGGPAEWHGLPQHDGAYEDIPSGRRSRKPKASEEVKKQKTLQEIVNSKALTPLADDNTNIEAPNLAAPDPIAGAPTRKRKRPTQLVAPPELKETREVANSTPEVNGPLSDAQEPSELRRASSPMVVIPPSSPPRRPFSEPGDYGDAEAEAVESKTPTKKVLRLNAHGKFSSPIKKGKPDDEAEPEAPRRRGRPRKPKEPARLVVVLPYWHDISRLEAMGDKIERILSGEDH
ncbi:hypothetical protein LTR53_016401, partial [Teratosphaeriaceae sp. CCFEE 6253]